MNEQDISTHTRRGCNNSMRGSNLWTGLFFLLVGGLLFARASGVDFPHWFFSWPMILIALGMLMGLRDGFRSGGGVMLLLIGGLFLADKISPDFDLLPYFWPIIFIAAGLFMVIRPSSFRRRRKREPDNDTSNSYTGESNLYSDSGSSKTGDGVNAEHSEILDIVSVFAGIKKKVLSKRFRGGDIVAFMGGAEVNLSQADIGGRINIDTLAMFGGIKLIVPADWDVQTEVVAIFGGVEDKRPVASLYNPGKVLYLQGTCIFGGIEIKAY